MGLFQEYMDAKGKVVKPKVDISGGDPSPKTPPNAPKGGGKPYVANGGKKGSKGEKGFGDKGDQSLKYNPVTDHGKGKEPAKIPTVEQVEISAFVADAASRDQTLIENIVRQLKSHGLMGPLVAEMLQHRETYKHISEIMGHKEYGESTCKSMVRAMREEVSSPFHQQMNLGDDEVPSEEDEYADNADTSDEMGIEDEGEDMPCQTCNPDGSGMQIDPECPECMGQGFVPNGEGLDVGMEDPLAMGDPTGQQDPLMQMQNMPAMRNFQRAMMGRF